MRSRRTRATRGTSFMDVLVGILITSVTLGIALPQIPAIMEPYRLATAARVVASNLSVARMKAIAQNRRHRLNINDEAGTYVLEVETAANTWSAVGGIHELPTGCSFSEITTAPTFDTRGMLAQGYDIELNGAEASKTVSVNILGNVAIHAS